MEIKDRDKQLIETAKRFPHRLSKRQKAHLREVVDAQKAEYVKIFEIYKHENPFWYYEPVMGQVPEDRMAFLRKHIHAEDIPQKLDSALDVHQSTASIRGASGGNQSSKTTLGCIEALIKATGALPFIFHEGKPGYKYPYPPERLKRNGPQHVRIIAEDYQNGILRNLIPTFRKWTPKEFLKNGQWDKSYSAGEQVLRLYKSGEADICGTIEFMSNKQDLGTFQGPPRHMLIFDEEPLLDIYKENLMRFTTAGSLDILFCMTPTKGLSWTYDLYTKGRDVDGNNVQWYQISSVCNPHANLQVLDEIMSEMESYEEKKMRLLGEYISLSGLVYGKLFQYSVHVIPPFPSSCTCGVTSHVRDCPYSLYLHFLGVDPHMVKDSTAADCFLDREDNFFVDRCYKRGVNTDQFKLDIRRMLAGKRLGFSVFDPSSDSALTIHGGLNIFDLCTKGVNKVPRARKAEKYQGSIAAGVDTIKRRLIINERTKKPRFFIFDRPENQELIKSMKTLQRDSYFNEDIKGQKDRIREGPHDHHACVRYILQNKIGWRLWVEQSPEAPIPNDIAVLL